MNHPIAPIVKESFRIPDPQNIVEGRNSIAKARGFARLGYRVPNNRNNFHKPVNDNIENPIVINKKLLNRNSPRNELILDTMMFGR
jgi:hypothetical protein